MVKNLSIKFLRCVMKHIVESFWGSWHDDWRDARHDMQLLWPGLGPDRPDRCDGQLCCRKRTGPTGQEHQTNLISHVAIDTDTHTHAHAQKVQDINACKQTRTIFPHPLCLTIFFLQRRAAKFQYSIKYVMDSKLGWTRMGFMTTGLGWEAVGKQLGRLEWNRMAWHGIASHRMAWAQTEWNGMEGNGTECNGMAWNGMECSN